MRLRFLVLLGCLSALAYADCGTGMPPADTTDMGPRHHPVGRPLPPAPAFNQPDGCKDGVWFFDQDHNGNADPREPTLYGPDRVVACGSCHGDSPEEKTTASASVFLRQNAATLCLVCHNI